MIRPLRFPLVLASAVLFSMSAYAQTNTTNSAGVRAASVSGFGSSVLIDGSDILIGRSGLSALFPEPANQTGSVLVFRLDGGVWGPAYALEAEGVDLADGFGAGMSRSGDLLAVTAPMAGGGCGEVHAYSRTDGKWMHAATLSVDDCGESDHAGQSVLVRDGRIYVGAPGRNEDKGSVLVYEMSMGSWKLASELTSDFATKQMGSSLAAFGSGLFAGEPLGSKNGRVHFFPRTETDDGFGSAVVFTPSDTTVAMFGASLESHGPHLAVGSPGVSLTQNSGYPPAPGAVVVLEEKNGNWSELRTLRMDSSAVEMVPNAGPNDFAFGASVGASGNEAWISGLIDGAGRGAIRIYRFSDGLSGTTQVLTDSSLSVFSTFGENFAVSDHLAAVVATRANFGDGKVYVYRKDADTGMWMQAAVLLDQSRVLEAATGDETTCVEGDARGFGCSDVDLVSFLPVTQVGAEPGDIVNDLWGWTDESTGREYVIIGHSFSTSFVDITNASNPILLGTLPATEGSSSNVWRDIKVYKDHAFIVADGAGEHGMQVFDLRQLRNLSRVPMEFEETAHYDGIHSAHNIVIDEESGFAYATGASSGGETCGGGLHMIDIRNPENPTFAGCFNDQSTQVSGRGYSHDAQCIVYSGPDADYTGKEICFGSNETALSIADVTDKENPVAVATVAYPDVSYAHQGWVTDDQRFFYMNDEGDELSSDLEGTRTLIWDIEDLDDPVFAGEYFGETKASDHNLYVKGNLMYESNYVSGLRIIDISNPTEPTEVGHFDTFPWGENDPGYAGSWSNYPYFKSGVIAVSSMKEGLFLVRYNKKAF